MTCRAACVPGVNDVTATIYVELAAAGRWDDFRWLGQSQGLAAERIVLLWEHLRAPDADG
jgi:hypothetical protein